MLLDPFLRLSPLQAVIHPSGDPAWCYWTSSTALPFPAVTHPTVDRAWCCLTFFFVFLLFRRTPIQVPTWPAAAGLHLRLSSFPAVTQPTLDRGRCCWIRFSAVPFSGGHPSMFRSGLVLLDFIFGRPVSGGHPSHCRPSPVLLYIFRRLSTLQAVTHPSPDLARCCWTSCSAIPFPVVTHPTADRDRCCLTFSFDCILFR